MFPLLAPILVGLAPTAPVVAPASPAPIHRTIPPAPPPRVPISPRSIVSLPASIGGGNFAVLRDGGRTPYEWGISRACQRMVRANKFRRARQK